MDRVLQVLDLDADGQGGAWSVEPAGSDWWAGAAERFARDRRRRREPGLRLRWEGSGRFDWAAGPNPSPPAWVDVIAPGEGESFVRVRLAHHGGEVMRVAVELFDGSGRHSTRLLRRIGEGGLLLRRIDGMLASWSVVRILGDPWRVHVQRPGRAGRDDVDYARWALRYVEALREAPDRPIPWLLEAERVRPVLGESVVVDTSDQARAYLRRARARGLLTRPEPGRAGGELTAKGRKVLREAGIDVKREG